MMNKHTEKKKAQRFTNRAVTNFIAMLALFIFIFVLHQVAGNTKSSNTDVDDGSISATLPPANIKSVKQPAIKKGAQSGIDLAAILMPNSAPARIKAVCKPVAKPVPKKVAITPTPEKPRVDKAKTKKRSQLVRRTKKRRPSVREIESTIPVEALDGESARLRYISLNRGLTPTRAMESLNAAEDLDGESTRLRYIAENKRLANSTITQSNSITPDRNRTK